MGPNSRFWIHMLRLHHLLILVTVLGACNTARINTPQADQTMLVAPPELVTALSTEERSKTVVWDISSGSIADLEQWNPLARDARREKGFHQMMIEPLFILNYESGAIEPWLAERMMANEALDVWTLELREGVTWSDGEPFQADDVVFTVELMLEYPELELDFAAGFIDMVKQVKQVDDHTVQFTLTRPNPRFQLDYFSVKIWGSFAIVPEHIWRDKDPLTFKNYDPEQGWPVFTGPYILDHFDETGFVYIRNDDWWGAQTGFKPLPEPERMIWVLTDSEETRVEWMSNKWMDAMGDILPDNLATLKQRNPDAIAWFDGLPYAWVDPCSRTLSINHLNPPWGDKDMRWALNYAIDREKIVGDALQGTTLPSKHFFPAYPPLDRYVSLLEETGLYEEYPIILHDPQRAQQLIESKGWVQNDAGYYEQDGTELSLTIHTHSGLNDTQEVARIIAEGLEAIGIRSSMKPLSEKQWVAHKTSGDFEAMIDWDSCGSVNEPWAALDRYHARWFRPLGEPVSNYNNQVRWQNAAYSDLVDEMAVLPLGDPKVDTLFVDTMTIWMEELPFIPITQARQLVLFDTTYWTGWPTSENSYIHPPSWWQSTHIVVHNLKQTE